MRNGFVYTINKEEIRGRTELKNIVTSFLIDHWQDSYDLPSHDDVSHRAVFGDDDIDEEELLDEIESDEKNDDDNKVGKESSSDGDSEGPDQVDSDDQVELMETERGIIFF